MREVQGNRLYLTACKEQVRVEGISKHKKEMKITAYCTFEEETANNKNLVSAQEKHHMACATWMHNLYWQKMCE